MTQELTLVIATELRCAGVPSVEQAQELEELYKFVRGTLLVAATTRLRAAGREVRVIMLPSPTPGLIVEAPK